MPFVSRLTAFVSGILVSSPGSLPVFSGSGIVRHLELVGWSFSLAASIRRQRHVSAWDPMNVAAEQTVHKSDLIGNQQTKDKAKHSGCHSQIPSQAGKPLLAIDEC